MADHDYRPRAVKAFEEWMATIETIAQESASTEAVLYKVGLPEDEHARMRLEYELHREVECWEAITELINARVADRRKLLETPFEKRRLEREADGEA